MQLQLLNLNKSGGSGDPDSILGSKNSQGSFSGFQGSGGSKWKMDVPQHIFHTPVPKIEFPRFDGSNPRAWTLKCNSYFKIVSTILDHQKINLASMHFVGKALQWFQNLGDVQPDVTWEQFLDIVSVRFEGIREAKVIVEFNKLRQTGSYSDYVDQFEELKSCMLLSNHNKFSEDYFVASFISGLSEELQYFVSMFKPTTLEQAIELGGQQLTTLEIISKKMKSTPKPFQNSTNYKKPDSSPYTKNTSQLALKPPTQLLTKAEMAVRRQKGLCYNCDERFTAKHICKNRVCYLMMSEEEELNYIQGRHVEQGIEDSLETPMEEIQLSMQSIVGDGGVTTMKVIGEVNGHKLHILVDTGSTLSFLQEDTSKKLGCKLEEGKPLLVRVANGQKMISTQKATNFSWKVQGHVFTYTPRILGNTGYDLILGGDWLKHCTPIELDYKKMTFSVHLNGHKVKLQAINSVVECHHITEVGLYSLLHKNWDEEICSSVL